MQSNLRKTIASLAAIVCGFSVFAYGQNISSRQIIGNAVAGQTLRGGQVAVFAIRGQSDTLVDINRCQRMLPASNAKLVTTGIALQFLGPEWKYRTSLAYSGKIKGGVLEGDLYIVGSGDPTIASSHDSVKKAEQTFEEWKTILDKAGIRKIKGLIIGDGRCFDGNSFHGDWMFDDLGTDYGTGPEGLNFYENVQDFAISGTRVAGQSVTISPEYPSAPWLRLTVASRFNDSEDNLWFYNDPFFPVASFVGDYGTGNTSKTWKGSNKFAAYTCAHEFFLYLASAGLSSSGYADIGQAGNVRTDLMHPTEGPEACDNLTVIGYSESQPLRQIIRDCNVFSDNFYAETLIRTVSKEITGSADYSHCTEARDSVLRSIGIENASECRFDDGSGLSTYNWLTAEFLLNFLTEMQNSEFFPDYLASLPQPGEGTLSSLFRDEPENFRKRIHMKSGSFTGTLSYSGYILSEDGDPGKTIVFSILTNNMTSPSNSVKLELQKIIKSLANDGNQL